MLWMKRKDSTKANRIGQRKSGCFFYPIPGGTALDGRLTILYHCAVSANHGIFEGINHLL